MNGDGSDLRIVFRGALAAGRPAWSPDGISLAFESDSAHHHEPSANGQNASTIVPGEAHNPAWSPDLIRIAFDSPSQPDGPGSSYRTRRADSVSLG